MPEIASHNLGWSTHFMGITLFKPDQCYKFQANKKLEFWLQDRFIQIFFFLIFYQWSLFHWFHLAIGFQFFCHNNGVNLVVKQNNYIPITNQYCVLIGKAKNPILSYPPWLRCCIVLICFWQDHCSIQYLTRYEA